MDVVYAQKRRVVVQGQCLTPRQTATAPRVSFAHRPHALYTLALVDPDAVGGTKIHWLVGNIPGQDVRRGTTLVPYQGPAPPPHTGVHRYWFYVWDQASGRLVHDTHFTSRYI